MKKSLIILLVMMLILSFSVPLSSTVVFADDDDYIEIWNVDDLYNVRTDMSANYKLMCDIDMSEAVAEGGQYNYSGKGWCPHRQHFPFSTCSFASTV